MTLKWLFRIGLEWRASLFYLYLIPVRSLPCYPPASQIPSNFIDITIEKKRHQFCLLKTVKDEPTVPFLVTPAHVVWFRLMSCGSFLYHPVCMLTMLIIKFISCKEVFFFSGSISFKVHVYKSDTGNGICSIKYYIIEIMGNIVSAANGRFRLLYNFASIVVIFDYSINSVINQAIQNWTFMVKHYYGCSCLHFACVHLEILSMHAILCEEWL